VRHIISFCVARVPSLQFHQVAAGWYGGSMRPRSTVFEVDGEHRILDSTVVDLQDLINKMP
jgi:hypothetical protein